MKIMTRKKIKYKDIHLKITMLNIMLYDKVHFYKMYVWKYNELGELEFIYFMKQSEK